MHFLNLELWAFVFDWLPAHRRDDQEFMLAFAPKDSISSHGKYHEDCHDTPPKVYHVTNGEKRKSGLKKKKRVRYQLVKS